MLLHINTNLCIFLNINIFVFDCSGALHGVVIYSEVPYHAQLHGCTAFRLVIGLRASNAGSPSNGLQL